MTKPVIVKRSVKGSALTFTELDTNFQNLDDATITLKAGSGGTDVVSDLNGVITLVATDGLTLTGNNTSKEIAIDASLVRDLTPQLGGNLDILNYTISNSNALGLRLDVTGDHLRLTGGSITTPNNTTGLNLTTNVGAGGTIVIPGAANGNIEIIPNGTGDILLTADTVTVGDTATAATITTNGAGNLTLSTNAGTNSGTIAITQGTNGNITVTPNGTGLLLVSGQTVGVRTNNTGGVIIGRQQTTTSGAYQYPSLTAQKARTDILVAAMTSEPANIGFSVRDSASVNTTFGRLACTYQGSATNPFYRFSVSADGFTTSVDCVTFGGGVANWGSAGSYTHTTVGTTDLILSTNEGTNSGTITINDGANGNITLTPNGTGRTSVTNLSTTGGIRSTLGTATVAPGATYTPAATIDSVTLLTISAGSGAVTIDVANLKVSSTGATYNFCILNSSGNTISVDLTNTTNNPAAYNLLNGETMMYVVHFAGSNAFAASPIVI